MPEMRETEPGVQILRIENELPRVKSLFISRK